MRACVRACVRATLSKVAISMGKICPVTWMTNRLLCISSYLLSFCFSNLGVIGENFSYLFTFLGYALYQMSYNADIFVLYDHSVITRNPCNISGTLIMMY